MNVENNGIKRLEQLVIWLIHFRPKFSRIRYQITVADGALSVEECLMTSSERAYFNSVRTIPQQYLFQWWQLWSLVFVTAVEYNWIDLYCVTSIKVWCYNKILSKYLLWCQMLLLQQVLTNCIGGLMYL